MQAHVRCLNLTVEILDYLRSGDKVLQHLEELGRLQQLHHECCYVTFRQCLKPKVHLQRHAVRDMEENGINCSCFPGERNLRRPKSIGAYAFRNFTSTMLNYVLKAFLENVKDPDRFKAVKLVGTRQAIPSSKIAGVCPLSFRSCGRGGIPCTACSAHPLGLEKVRPGNVGQSKLCLLLDRAASVDPNCACSQTGEPRSSLKCRYDVWGLEWNIAGVYLLSFRTIGKEKSHALLRASYRA